MYLWTICQEDSIAGYAIVITSYSIHYTKLYEGKPFPGMKIALVKFDTGRGEVLRGADGRCQPCAPGEPGELLGRISEGRSARNNFV